MYLIGLTGGIASGKSTVSSIFQSEHGIPVIDADLIAKEVVEPNTKGWHRVVNIFGREILNQDESLNRDKLGEIVFSDVSKRRRLNKALHGLIAFEMLKKVLKEFLKGTRYVILDVPLLFESKFALSLMSYKLVVYCADEQVRLNRLMKRNPQLSESDARLRIQSQMNAKKQVEMADLLIDNSYDIEQTKKQIEQIARTFRKSKKYLYIRLALALIAASFLSSIFVLFRKLF